MVKVIIFYKAFEVLIVQAKSSKRDFSHQQIQFVMFVLAILYISIAEWNICTL